MSALRHTHIEAVAPGGSDFESYHADNGEPLRAVEGLSRVSIFVGPNNSGKSRLLRLLMDLSHAKVVLAGAQGETLKRALDDCRRVVQDGLSTWNAVKLVTKNGPRDQSDVPRPFVRLQANGVDPLLDELRELTQPQNLLRKDGSSPTNVPAGLATELNALYARIRPSVEGMRSSVLAYRPTPFYIPALRGLRSLSPANGDPFGNRIREEYGLEKHAGLNVFTGQTMNLDVRRLLLGDLTERARVERYETELSNRFFDGRPTALIPKEGSDVLSVKIGGEQEQPIHHLGDGLQSILIQTFPLAAAERACVFIEEPELYLHPGMQRRLLKWMLDEKNHQFFLATHSNHLLDMSLDFEDISVFTVRKNATPADATIEELPTFSVERVSAGDRSSLELLGVRNSSVFLVNATIWVEGVTDRLYLRKYLELYQKYLLDEFAERRAAGGADGVARPRIFEEDVHFSFVEYGGGNIAHWSFVEGEDKIAINRLCSRAFLVADRDDANKNKARKEALKQKLGDSYYELNVREVENLLTPEVLRATVVELSPANDKPELPEFGHSRYARKRVGSFIQVDLLGGEPKVAGPWADRYGSLRRKLRFCTASLKRITWETMGDEAKALATILYEFVQKQNQG